MKLSRKIVCLVVIGLLFGACNSGSDRASNRKHIEHDSSVSVQEDTGGTGRAMTEMMQDMHSMEPTGNVDLDFAVMMKSHHEGALDMSQEELKSGRDERVKALASAIVDAQKAEVESLDKFISLHKGAVKTYDVSNKEEGFAKVLDKSMRMMMDMPKATDGSIDQQFIRMMIPHHQSAVYMSEGYLKYGKDEKLKEMAGEMVTDQSKEIEEMKKLDIE
jgi:uncharacterized protein (DUF305 family)